MTIWIGISGPIASGKSTLALLLFMAIEGKVVVIPFAHALKQLVHNVRAYQGDKALAARYVYLFLEENSPSTPSAILRSVSEDVVRAVSTIQDYRTLLQYVGTDIIRERVHPRFWVDIVARQLPLYDVVISDDVRFLNEARSVDTHIRFVTSGFEDVYAERLEKAMQQKGKGIEDHPSERALVGEADIFVPLVYRFKDVQDALKQRHPQLVFEEVVHGVESYFC